MADRMGMLIDASKCMGCRGCQVACKQWNDLPATKTAFSGSYENPPQIEGNTWTKVKFSEDRQSDGTVSFRFLKVQCMHCTEASCISVCASGAATRMDNGYVIIDQNKCIGCRNCVLACPYQAVAFDPATGTSRKCWSCQNRLENNLQPACVKTCPSGALGFGKREDMLALAKKRAQELKTAGKDAYIYGEKELGGTNIMYVLDAPPKVYGLPENPKPATAGVSTNWMGVLVGAGIMAFAPFKILFSDKSTGVNKTPEAGVNKNA
ncbi:MAG: 4Fe-4S ferredoxin [Firmicutes bacterium HGW-Firmicutes-14]|nr:MAG: 4Fe-4S ferredoxin [Firmicutes bacterium HGW-Firmicutes-14]